MSKIKSILLTLGCVALMGGLWATLNSNSLFASEEEPGGAKQFVGKVDIKNSPYFPQLDIYNMKSNENLIILSNFKTQQQNTGYTCGPVAANMVVQHFNGQPLHKEMEIAKIMGTNKFNGTTTKEMVKYFDYIGWETRSSVKNIAPETYEDFLKFVTTNLKDNTPIIVENVDWGGHWRVIMGYDSMGTKHTGDDVLFMADPFDTSDHLQDGYNILSAERFFYMWFDHQLFKKADQNKQWLIAKPKKQH